MQCDTSQNCTIAIAHSLNTVHSITLISTVSTVDNLHLHIALHATVFLYTLYYITHHVQQVTFAEMLSTTLRLSLLPIVLGAAINSNAKGVSSKLKPYTHIASSLLIGIVTGSTVARNAYAITHYGARLLLAVTAMHTGGFILGYVTFFLLYK
jgi:predicted Na+-dependent transporter